jgi:hypothetical protein
MARKGRAKPALTVVKLVAKLIIKLCFGSVLFGGGAAEYYDRCFEGSDVVLPLVGLSCPDQTGSSCKVSLIAVLWERLPETNVVALLLTIYI